MIDGEWRRRNEARGEGDSEAVYLVRGSVLSLSSNQTNQKNQTDEMNQRNQIPAARCEMGPGTCSSFRVSGFETDAAGSRYGWFHELTDGLEERMDMAIVRFDTPL